MQTIANSKFSLFFVILTVLYVWHTAVPYIGVNMPAVVNALIMAMLLMIMLLDNSFKMSKALLCILPMFILSIFDLISYSPSQWLVQLYGLAQQMIFPLIMLYLMQNGSTTEKRSILLLVLTGYAVTCITTYLGCLTNPGAARQLATSISENDPALFNMYRQLNIGSFTFVYTVVLLLPLTLYVIRNRERYYLHFTLFAIISVVAVFETEYATALLMMLSVLLLIFFPPYCTVYNLKNKVGLILFLIIFAWLVLPVVFDYIIPYIDSDTMRERLEDVSATLKGDVVNSQGGDLESRKELFNISINGFLGSPIWGTGTTYGGHSFLLDTMSKYGLIGFIFIVIMYKRVYTLYVRPYQLKPYYGYLLYMLIMALVLAVLNPIDNLLALTFLAPLFAEVYSDEIKTT